MTINKNNIEAYLLDYMEGNLNPLLTAELMAFLAENPEFEKYLPDNDPYSFSADNLVFGSKEILRKDYYDVPVITTANFDEFCIAASEGLLNKTDVARLNAYIADDPELRKDFEIYRLLRLKPDLNIKFGNNGLLKKSGRSLISFRTLYLGIGVAASIAVLTLLFVNRYKQATSAEESKITGVINETLSSNNSNSLRISPNKESITINKTDNQNQLYRKKSPGSINEKATGDLQQPSARVIIPLKKINPLVASEIHSPYQKELTYLPETENNPELTWSASKAEDGDETLLSSLISKVDFWKTAETALNGFNQLTESRLSISKTIDESGNIKSLQFHTESYTIASNNLK